MQRLPDGYTLDSAKHQDIDAIIAVDLAAGQLFAPTGLLDPDALQDHVPADVLSTAIENDNLIVARAADASIAGFALVSNRSNALYLDQISVHPDHGRKGLGAVLVRCVLDLAKTRKAKRVALSTFRDLPWNGPFYRRLGFREIPKSKLTDWMKEIEAVQAEAMDVSKRCFMQVRVSWL